MTKTTQELAREWDDKIKAGREGEGLTPVKGVIKANADSIYSMRFTREEIALLRSSAAARGIKLSEFIREAVMDAARHEGSVEPTIVRRVQEQVKELAETVRRL
ncbi:MAG: hypothetical protein GEU75_11095 [Dehalococcoidia bacterium]|nr:hypothetical protein [Dehalococcoidia bacterium]